MVSTMAVNRPLNHTKLRRGPATAANSISSQGATHNQFFHSTRNSWLTSGIMMVGCGLTSVLGKESMSINIIAAKAVIMMRMPMPVARVKLLKEKVSPMLRIV